MPRLARILTPLLAAALIAIGGASSALAAAPTSNAASTYSWDLDDSWCFDDVVLQYCFDVSGRAQFVDTAQQSSVVANERFHTVVSKAGVQVAESSETSFDRFVIQPDGTYVQQEVVHTRSSYGDQTCSIQVVWRQAEFETVVDHWSASCS